MCTRHRDQAHPARCSPDRRDFTLACSVASIHSPSITYAPFTFKFWTRQLINMSATANPFNLKKQLAFYGAYHTNPVNVGIHIIGVPSIIL